MENMQDCLIYNNVHNIVVKRRLDNEKECTYRFTVEMSRGPIDKVLVFKLTDDIDSTFLFSLVLTQEDFGCLKSEQGLRVDFENFPRYFTKLLTDCKSHQHQFSIILDDCESEYSSARPLTNGLFLKIIERNEFKNICHLSLRLAPGTEEDIRQHLCNKLKCLQDELSNERKINSQIEKELEKKTALLVTNSRKVNDLELKLAEDRSASLLESNQRIAEEQERHSRQVKELETKHEEIVKELKSNLDLITYKYNSCCDAKSRLETTVRELTIRKETLDKDTERLSSKNESLRATVSKLDQRIVELEQLLSVTERDLSSSEKNATELAKSLNQARRDIQTLSEREAGMKRHICTLESQLKVSTSQLSQSGFTIKDLEDEVASKRVKVANMLKVVQKLEGDLTVSNNELTLKTEKLAETEKNEADLIVQVEELSKKLKSVEDKLKESEEDMKKQRDVNTYLHRKLNEMDSNQSNQGALKCASLSSSLIARNLPTVMANSTALSPAVLQNRSQLTGNLSTKTLESSKPRLDPSYLMPDKLSTKKSLSKLEKSESAYFQK